MIARTETETGHSGWLVTFADLIALVLAFFVMMYATQKVEGGRWQAMVESLSRSLKTDRTPDRQFASARENVALERSRFGEDLAYLELLVADLKKSRPGLSSIMTHRGGDRLVIAIPGDILFAPSSAKPLAGTSERMTAVAHLLRNTKNRVELYGHAAQQAAGPTAWRLSLERAMSARHLLSAGGYDRPVRVFGVGAAHAAELDRLSSESERLRHAHRVDIVVRAEQDNQK